MPAAKKGCACFPSGLQAHRNIDVRHYGIISLFSTNDQTDSAPERAFQRARDRSLKFQPDNPTYQTHLLPHLAIPLH
jgi:hypothetical protein